jgi:hypothetical protein
MIAGAGDRYITASADQLLISQKMSSACLAKPGEKKTDEIVPQIV